jgi:peroxiredoxin
VPMKGHLRAHKVKCTQRAKSEQPRSWTSLKASIAKHFGDGTRKQKRDTCGKVHKVLMKACLLSTESFSSFAVRNRDVVLSSVSKSLPLTSATQCRATVECVSLFRLLLDGERHKRLFR